MPERAIGQWHAIPHSSLQDGVLAAVERAPKTKRTTHLHSTLFSISPEILDACLAQGLPEAELWADWRRQCQYGGGHSGTLLANTHLLPRCISASRAWLNKPQNGGWLAVDTAQGHGTLPFSGRLRMTPEPLERRLLYTWLGVGPAPRCSDADVTDQCPCFARNSSRTPPCRHATKPKQPEWTAQTHRVRPLPACERTSHDEAHLRPSVQLHRQTGEATDGERLHIRAVRGTCLAGSGWSGGVSISASRL